MLASIASEALSGLEGKPVQVEADVVAAAPAFYIVGLPDAAVQESRERVRAAIVNSAYAFPSRRITVNLAPADLRKEGPSFDLPIALAFLVATGQAADGCDGRGPLAAVGELGLDGTLRPVAGALALAESLRRRGMRGLILPAANAAEAALVDGLEVYPARTLAEAVTQLAAGGGAAAPPADLTALLGSAPAEGADFADIMGQEQVKRALEIAVAGAHNVLMSGPPGAGKTMLARRLPGIMPALTLDEAIEVTRIYSVAGLLPQDRALITQRPFRAPHHTISSPGLVGGGGTPRPGEVSLAHLGVLFLDEFAEFRLAALEGLRQPLEDGEVTISRSAGKITLPCAFMLVAAMNPCPCGYLGDPKHECRCSPTQIQRYRSRISGPLLDRIDLLLTLQRAGSHPRPELTQMSSEQARQRVLLARERQLARLRPLGLAVNARMDVRALREHVRLDECGEEMMRRVRERGLLSARGEHRVMCVARTIADLGASERVRARDLGAALALRAQAGLGDSRAA